jgi:hypothetical protein
MPVSAVALLLLLSSELLNEILRVRFVACMWEVKNAYNILLDNPEGKNHVRHLSMGGINILKYTAK